MPGADVPTGKALHLLQDIIALQGTPFSARECSDRLGMPTPNLYRHLQVLMASGYLVRPRRGQYLPHPQFLSSLQAYSAHGVLKAIAKPLLEAAAPKIPATLHFGVFENDMVTYLVKVDSTKDALFTEESIQLEAYCSAIGKVLLAALPKRDLDAYLADADFPRLTDNTLTAPEEIRRELTLTKRRGYGIDNREIDEDLICLAVPVSTKDGDVVGAVSAASRSVDLMSTRRKRTIGDLRTVAQKIGNLL